MLQHNYETFAHEGYWEVVPNEAGRHAARGCGASDNENRWHASSLPRPLTIMSTTSNVLTASPISFKQLWDSAPTVRMVPLPTDDVRRYPFTFYFTLSIVRGDNVPEMLPAFLGDVIAHLDGPKQTVTFSVQDRVACRRISLVHPSRLDGVNKSVLPMIKDRHDETWYLTLTPQGGLSWVHDRETSKGLFTQSMRRDCNDNQAMYRRALELCMTAYPDPDHTAMLVYPPKPFGEPNVQDDAASAGPSRSRRTLIPSAKAQQKEQVIKRKVRSLISGLWHLLTRGSFRQFPVDGCVFSTGIYQCVN